MSISTKNIYNITAIVLELWNIWNILGEKESYRNKLYDVCK